MPNTHTHFHSAMVVYFKCNHIRIILAINILAANNPAVPRTVLKSTMCINVKKNYTIEDLSCPFIFSDMPHTSYM